MICTVNLSLSMAKLSLIKLINQDKSAASFCHQVAASVPDIFCDFYAVKNNKITKKLLATTKAGEKISTIIKNFDTGLAKFENN